MTTRGPGVYSEVWPARNCRVRKFDSELRRNRGLPAMGDLIVCDRNHDMMESCDRGGRHAAARMCCFCRGATVPISSALGFG